MPPAFGVAGDLAHRAPEVLWQAEADDGEDLAQPLQDAVRDARKLVRSNFRLWLQEDLQPPEIDFRLSPSFGHSHGRH